MRRYYYPRHWTCTGAKKPERLRYDHEFAVYYIPLAFVMTSVAEIFFMTSKCPSVGTPAMVTMAHALLPLLT